MSVAGREGLRHDFIGLIGRAVNGWLDIRFMTETVLRVAQEQGGRTSARPGHCVSRLR